jgi:aryl-alcohol dehydrogenase-like predicted oxidoreductase
LHLGDDWRKRPPDFNEPKLSANLVLVEHLRSIVERRGLSPEIIAIAWILRHAAVTGAIVGARKPEQVEEMAVAATVQLTQSEIKELEGLAELTH